MEDLEREEKTANIARARAETARTQADHRLLVPRFAVDVLKWLTIAAGVVAAFNQLGD